MVEDAVLCYHAVVRSKNFLEDFRIVNGMRAGHDVIWEIFSIEMYYGCLEMLRRKESDDLYLVLFFVCTYNNIRMIYKYLNKVLFLRWRCVCMQAAGRKVYMRKISIQRTIRRIQI